MSDPNSKRAVSFSSAFTMRGAVFHAMAISLWRDRATFALTFILPPIIFTIFAAVFSAAASGDLSIRIGVTAPQDSISRDLVAGLEKSPLISSLEEFQTITALKENISNGQIDAGIEIQRPSLTEVPLFNIHYDPVKEGAATIADAALSSLANLGSDDEEEDISAAVEPAKRISIVPGTQAIPMASYYVAGVGLLFLFLSGFQSALTMIEERDAGVLERIGAGPLGLRPMIDGKFAFLVCQGFVQLLIILIVAKLLFAIPITAPLLLIPSFLFASICAAGLCILIVGACRSRSQAHAIGAVLALILGAIGGSMAPRFLMAEQISKIGALTPNAWGIEAIGVSLWRSGDISLAYAPWLALGVTGVVSLILSYLVTQKTLGSG